MDDSAAAGAPVLCQRGVRGTRMCCFVNKELRVLLYQVYHRSHRAFRGPRTLYAAPISRSRGGTWLPSPIRDPGLGGAGLGTGRGPEAETRPAPGGGARGGRGAGWKRLLSLSLGLTTVRGDGLSRAALSHSLCPKLIAVVCALSSVYLSRDRSELTIEIELPYTPLTTTPYTRTVLYR